MKYLYIFASLLVFSYQVYGDNSSSDGEFFLMPEVGVGTLKISGDLSLSGESLDEDGSVVGLILGYQTPTNLVLGGSFSETVGFSVFGAEDGYDVNEWSLFVGYSASLTERLRLVPAVGWSSWRLIVEEGQLLNPGPEIRRVTRGKDVFGRLNFELTTQTRFDYTFSLIYGEYDDFSYRAGRIGLKYKF